MGEKLKSPPLVEAVCEFRFAPAGSWDWTLPGRLYDRIGSEFSEKDELEGIAVEVAAGKTEIAQAPDRLQMKRKDGSALVQVGPHMLAINHLPVYPGWEAFRDLALRIYSSYLEICSDAPIERIGLRYINRIPLLGTEFNLEDYMTLDPPLTGALQRPLAGFYQRYELQHDAPPGLLVHQTGIHVIDKEIWGHNPDFLMAPSLAGLRGRSRGGVRVTFRAARGRGGRPTGGRCGRDGGGSSGFPRPPRPPETAATG